VEATYRNDIEQVAEMLNARHNNHYMIWNLSQRIYDYSLFHDMIQPMGWPDHHAPALSLLFKIVSAMDSWLKADKMNVAVVHCMAGKGRTGTVICSYLLYCGEFDDPIKAIHFFGRKRSAIKAGVEQPSQQRYVDYFHEVINGFLPRPKIRELKRIVLRPVPSFSHLNGIRPVLHIFDTSEYPETPLYTNAPVPDIDIRHYAPYEGKVDIIFRVPIKLKGDILIRLYHLSSRFGGSMTASVPVLRAQFHTGFVSGDVLIFTKDDLDLAYKDKRCGPNFEMRLYFEPDVNEVGEDNYWNPETHHNFMAVAKINKQKVSSQRHKKDGPRPGLSWGSLGQEESPVKSPEEPGHQREKMRDWVLIEHESSERAREEKAKELESGMRHRQRSYSDEPASDKPTHPVKRLHRNSTEKISTQGFATEHGDESSLSPLDDLLRITKELEDSHFLQINHDNYDDQDDEANVECFDLTTADTNSTRSGSSSPKARHERQHD